MVAVSRFVSHVDLLLNELRNARVQGYAGLPTPTADRAGQIGYLTPTGRLRICTGTEWNLHATDSDALQGQAPAFYRSRANHTGTQTVATLSDWDTALGLVPLSRFAPAVQALDLGGQRVTNGVAAQALTDLPTYGQVVDLLNNQGFKRTRAASTANVTLSAVTPGSTMDGVALALNDLVLLKDQASAIDNGIYRVGAGGLTRDPASDTATELPAGTVVVVSEGTVNGDGMFMLTTSAGYVVGTDPIQFTRYGTAPQPYTAGDGIDITTNTISAVAGSGIIVDATGIRLDPDALSGLGSVEMDVPVPGTGTSVTITHNLGRRPVPVAVMELATGNKVEPGVQYPDADSLVLWFDVAPTEGQYRVGIG